MLLELFSWTSPLLGYEMVNNRIREARDRRYLQSSLCEDCGITLLAYEKCTSFAGQLQLVSVKQNC